MRYRRHLLLLLAILAVFVAACGGADEPAEGASPAAGGGISTANTDLGTVLVDAQGKTLYGFTDDADGSSTCYDACADTWPPVPGNMPPGPNLDASVFTTTQREDGTTQLVAGEWPLYTFSGDAGPGDVNGQGSGGVWFVVAPDGSLIQDAGGASESAGGQGSATPPEGLDQPVLTDSRGMTLYYFRNDEPGSSNCNEPCSDTWPPVPATEQVDTSGLDPNALGPVTRDDGTEQLAYHGQPLYTFIDDVAPGDVNGQGVGDVWFAVAIDGSEIGPKGIRIGSTDAGDVLIDAEGFTLYTFANDSEGTSNCNDPCQETWPPVPADTAIDTTSVKEGQFDTITREDGSAQLAIDGQPLYRFKDDVNPGDANGEGVGDVWFTVKAGDVNLAGGGGGGDDDGGGSGEAGGGGGGAGEITVGDTDLGPTLVDAGGRTLYALTDDSAGTSTCNDACADAWPPVPGGVTIDESAVTADSTTITRDDGSSQLQIGEWPVYTFSGDGNAGDINGQGSGGVWFAVAPDGSLYQ